MCSAPQVDVVPCLAVICCPQSHNNSPAPRYDASYLSGLKASMPGLCPTANDCTGSYSIDVPMDEDMMVVDDIFGKGLTTLFLGSIR